MDFYTGFYNKKGEKISDAEWSDNVAKDKIVKQEYINYEYNISTVLLGLDHGWNKQIGDKPLIFETMVFVKHGGGVGIYCERYATEEEAINGHHKTCDKVRRGEIKK